MLDPYADRARGDAVVEKDDGLVGDPAGGVGCPATA
jgi:hypothetical protein